MKREIALDIAGQSIAIRSDEDEKYLRVLASFVDDKIREVSRGRKGVTTLNLTMMAALMIADELYKLRGSQEKIDGVLDRLSGKIEDSLRQVGA